MTTTIAPAASLVSNLGKFDVVSAISEAPIDRTHYGGGGGYHKYHHEQSHGSSGKHSIALTALTLLAFLFFLNILQNCLQEHMDQMNPQIIIMQARLRAREAEMNAEKRKSETAIPGFNKTEAFNKEPRTTTETSMILKKNYDFRKLSQVPVKLKQVEKYRQP